MDTLTFFQNIDIGSIAKIFFLILLGLFIVFIFMLINKIRSFDKIIIIQGAGGGSFLKALLYIYFVALLFLFITTIVIV